MKKEQTKKDVKKNTEVKVGRPKNIETAEQMFSEFELYKKEVKENPFKITDWVGGIGKQVTREKEKPLTLEGFEVFMYYKGYGTTLQQYFENREGRYETFVSICSLIRRIIRDDQIKGGMSGMFNPSITQRLNGLVEKSETILREQPLFNDDAEAH